MSRIQQVANNTRILAAKAPNFMRSVQEAALKLTHAAELIAMTRESGLANSVEATRSGIDPIMNNIAYFQKNAKSFADNLASGEESSSGSSSTDTAGVHGVFSEVKENGDTVITRIDPKTGNELRWYMNKNGQVYKAEATIRKKSDEGRTSAESRLTREVGNRTRGEYYDDGGHIFAAMFAGSNGEINLVPQDFHVNRAAYLEREKAIQRLLDEGHQVKITIDLEYKGDSTRPDAFIYAYEYEKDGLPVKGEARIVNGILKSL